MSAEGETQDEIQALAQIEVPQQPFCLEYSLNFFHQQGIQNCPFCNQVKQQQISFIPDNNEGEIRKLNYQQQILNSQDQIQKELMKALLNPSDPEVLMMLYEKYQDCECCKGFVFNCQGSICEQLGKCCCLEADLQPDS